MEGEGAGGSATRDIDICRYAFLLLRRWCGAGMVRVEVDV
jgi:hypothetical protein